MSTPGEDNANTDSYDGLSYVRLQWECKNAGLVGSGNAEILRQRLRTWKEFEDNVKRLSERFTTNESNKRYKQNLAADLICPITLELPWVPVTAEDGRVYERSAIEEHFKQHPGDTLKSPISNMHMGRKLLPAFQHKNIINFMVESGGIGGDLASKWNAQVEQRKLNRELLEKARGGDDTAMYEVGRNYHNGLRGFQKDRNVAVFWYCKSHEAGNVMGTALHGWSLCEGFGGKLCHEKGMLYIGIAAGQGSDFAAYILGMAMAEGRYGTTVNKNEAIQWLQKATENETDDANHLQFFHLPSNFKDLANAKLVALQRTANTLVNPAISDYQY